MSASSLHYFLASNLLFLILSVSQTAGILSDENMPGGVAVVGMHRSSTSLMCGLLSKHGFYAGDPGDLVGAQFFNPKGLFELRDVLTVDNLMLKEQNMIWSSSNIGEFRSPRSLQNRKYYSSMLNSVKLLEANAPWVLKEPRLCVTLQTWLPLFRTPPAVVFLYRNPLQVASSLQKRERNVKKKKTLDYWVHLWMVYNQVALRQTKDLCKVVVCHDDLVSDPAGQLNRILEELSLRCGLPTQAVQQSVVESFFRSDLDHHTQQLPLTEQCRNTTTQQTPTLRNAMDLYCSMLSGEAFDD